MSEDPAGSCELISLDAQALNQVMKGTVMLSNVSGFPRLVTLLPLPFKCWDDRSEGYQTGKCSGVSVSLGDSYEGYKWRWEWSCAGACRWWPSCCVSGFLCVQTCYISGSRILLEELLLEYIRLVLIGSILISLEPSS